EFQPGPRAEYFEVRTPDALVAKSLSMGHGSFSVPDPQADRPGFFDVTLPDGRPGRAVAIRLALDESPGRAREAVAFTVVVARDTARLRRILSAVMSAELASGLALLLIA